MEQQTERASCLLCGSEETEFNVILSTGIIVRAFCLCLSCREFSISDIVEELCTQDSQSTGDANGTE